MDGTTWLITGSANGFGRVLAETLLEKGHRVACTARRPEALADLVAAHGDRALALRLDVTLPDEIDAAAGAARAHFGDIDVLVNNAGYGQLGTVEQTPLEAARAVMETNYFGKLATIHAVLPEMIARGSGRIVNIGSVAGRIGFPAIGYYSASKFALAGLSESLAAEVAPLGIAVTLVELGPFDTGFAKAMAVVPPAPHYDMAALSAEAGNNEWGSGDDPRPAAEALVAAISSPAPPRRIVLGQPGLKVVALHDARRQAEAETWAALSRLEGAPGRP